MAEKVKVYPALVPSLVLVTEYATGVKCVTKLFGEVTPERETKERALNKYRAEQLQPAPPRRQRESTYIPRERARWEEFDEDEPVRGGGHR